MLASPSSKGRLAIPVESIVEIVRSPLGYSAIAWPSALQMAGSTWSAACSETGPSSSIATSARWQPEVSDLATKPASQVDGLFDWTRYIRRTEADWLHHRLRRRTCLAVVPSSRTGTCPPISSG